MQEILGLDLDDWFRGVRDWRTLLDFVEELPRGSRYRASLADDDDLAEAVIEADLPVSSAGPSLVGWTREMDVLADIQDLILLGLFRGSGKSAPRVPRPITAIQRAERRRIAARHNQVLDQMLPGRH